MGDRYETVRFFHCYKRGVDRVFVDHPLFLERVWGKTEEKIYGPDAGTDYPELNLPERFKSSFDFIDGYEKPVEGRKINWMKAGILEADRVLTVSPYYAEELISGIARGCELDNIMRLTGITGIVNGMDVSEWDPSRDKYIAVKYDVSTAVEAKALNKEALQAEVGLPVDRNIPLVAFIGRLEEQKGPDVMAAAIPQLMEMVEDVQIVLLGTGKKKFERMLMSAEEKFPGKVRAVVKFNAALAHHIMAGADVLAVTSRFEPCGLIQLQGMRYGTPCACASTGGLVDTIIEGKTGFHMGRLSVDCNVVEPADVKKVATTLQRAIKVVGTPAYEEMVRNCMIQDLSWKGPAKNWENVLLSLGVAGGEPGVEGEEIAPLAKENVAAP
ncbi:Granule-bound starch synthase 1 chloroplastic/amyloplastic [Zea mays]|uniref:NDP-glucose--starch glucosyltransferase n=1 Tax=Zea mays TaxID=4577 RepID=A0A1D6NW14_MAIZE|nr:Granule-bound starch synthase 1, chloroplastic/amyloplastic [Zea mays]ONM08990.1 Granule-bound starch synthase 1 chloroplastic/amyloplastic [Zea mays]